MRFISARIHTQFRVNDWKSDLTMGKMKNFIGCALLFVALIAVCLCPLVSADQDEASDKITLEYWKIFVTTENGTPFSVLVEQDDTVQDLRDTISEQEGLLFERVIPRMSVPMLVGAFSKLSNLNIRAGDTVNLVEPRNGHLDIVNFYIKTLDGSELPVTAPLGSTVASLKENITQLSGIPEAQQRLLFRGKKLKDERSLLWCGIKNGTILHLGRPLEDCSRAARIFVRTMSAASIELEVNLADTVINLKEKIWDKAGVPVGAQRLYTLRPERQIAGEDHLCDLGLESGSTVYMLLYSSRVTSLAQIERLQAPLVAHTVDPHKAPIFHEADEPGDLRKHEGQSIFKDSRNWFARAGERPSPVTSLFDPIAYLEPNPDYENWLRYSLEYLERISQRQGASEQQTLFDEIRRAQTKLALAVTPYRKAANLTTSSDNMQWPPGRVPHAGIALGGGMSSQAVPLGADISNWAPDAFRDPDIMRLFMVSERVREVLAKDARTGEGSLSFAKQRNINDGILYTYCEALAGYQPTMDYTQPEENEECGICRDDLAAEPSIKLACEHAFHADCILSWLRTEYKQQYFSKCPFCRRRTMFPYEKIGKAELESPELQSERDE